VIVSEREKFEAAMTSLSEQPEESFDKPYGSDDANTSWAVWQASRRAALEEAAQRIEPRNPPDDWTEYAKIRAEVAATIRALATGDKA
jgi:hypothetical protein